MPTDETDTRRCAVCSEVRRTIAKVGPFLIKEPCPNGCARGYVGKVANDVKRNKRKDDFDAN